MMLWILGAEGLLGKALQKACSGLGMAHVATGREVDITRKEQLLSVIDQNGPTHLINCAAYTDVDGAEKEKERAFAVNAEGPAHLGRLCFQRGMRLIHLSTDYVFDGKKGSPYTEEDLCAPVNVYGQSKHEGEKALLQELPTGCIVRTSWLFGEGGKNFLSKLQELLQNRERLEIDALQMNRPTEVSELVRVLWFLLNREGIWHVASRGVTTRFEVASYLLEELRKRGTGVKCAISPVTSVEAKGAPRPFYSALSTEKIEALTPLAHWKEVVCE